MIIKIRNIGYYYYGYNPGYDFYGMSISSLRLEALNCSEDIIAMLSLKYEAILLQQNGIYYFMKL